MGKISIILKTSDYRGDHSTDIDMACEVVEGETVEDLITRVLPEKGSRKEYHDCIVLRRIVPIGEEN